MPSLENWDGGYMYLNIHMYMCMCRFACFLLLSIFSLSEHSSDQHSSAVNHAPQSETTPTPATREQLYQALYDYDSQEDGDLQFKVGDIVQVSSEFPCGYKYS